MPVQKQEAKIQPEVKEKILSPVTDEDWAASNEAAVAQVAFEAAMLRLGLPGYSNAVQDSAVITSGEFSLSNI